eukprot:scaffold23134_cov70-Phaeocystis_antarctica.AAC.2
MSPLPLIPFNTTPQYRQRHRPLISPSAPSASTSASTPPAASAPASPSASPSPSRPSPSASVSVSRAISRVEHPRDALRPQLQPLVRPLLHVAHLAPLDEVPHEVRLLPAVAQLPCRAVLLRRLRPRLHPLDRPRLDNPHRALSVRILAVEHHQHTLDHLRAVAVRQHRAQPRAAVDVAALLPLLAPQRPSRRRGARTEDLQRRQRSQRADDRVRVLVRRHRRPALAHDGAHRVVRALRVVAHLPQQRAHERGALLGVAQLVDELGVLRGDRAAGLRPERRVRRAQHGAAVRGARQYLPAGTEHL